MRTRTKIRICGALACLATLSLISIRAYGTAAETDVAVIVNPNNPVNNLTLAELRKIYAGERQYWKTSTPVVPLMRSPKARERDVILRVIFQMTEDQYTQYWVAKAMRAEAADPPPALFSFGIMEEAVKNNPGAIGYVNFNDVRPGIKVLRVNGLLPREPGYALH